MKEGKERNRFYVSFLYFFFIFIYFSSPFAALDSSPFLLFIFWYSPSPFATGWVFSLVRLRTFYFLLFHFEQHRLISHRGGERVLTETRFHDPLKYEQENEHDEKSKTTSVEMKREMRDGGEKLKDIYEKKTEKREKTLGVVIGGTRCCSICQGVCDNGSEAAEDTKTINHLMKLCTSRSFIIRKLSLLSFHRLY
jgi:hypothetical protein